MNIVRCNYFFFLRDSGRLRFANGYSLGLLGQETETTGVGRRAVGPQSTEVTEMGRALQREHSGVSMDDGSYEIHLLGFEPDCRLLSS